MAYSLIARFSATILDEQNVEALAQSYVLVDPSHSFSDVITTFNTWLADLDACTDGQIIAARIHAGPTLPDGLKGAPVAGSRVEQTGIVNFSATGTTHRWGLAIPALKNSGTVIAAGKIVLTPGDPVPVLAALLTGGGTASLNWTNDNSQTIVALMDALISFRQRGKQLALATHER